MKKEPWKNDFCLWLRENDLAFRRFQLLAYILEKALTEVFIDSSEKAIVVAKNFLNVLTKCDEISYAERGMAEAYAILHFLDRYHRFQKIFWTLLCFNLLPIYSKDETSINCLDIGTGPAPALFALSDLYSAVKHFGKEKQLSHLENLKFNLDYAEPSEGFRSWLHYFTEIAEPRKFEKDYIDKYSLNIEASITDVLMTDWLIPYHHGSYYRIEEIPASIVYYSQLPPGTYRDKQRRFNFTIMSNFLTNLEMVEKSKPQLKEIARYLRNKGIILVVGASGKNSKYAPIYPEISNTIVGSYNSWKFFSRVNEVEPSGSSMAWSYGNRYGVVIKSFLRKILGHLDNLGAKQSIDAKVLERLERSTVDSYSYRNQWTIQIFQKESRFRKRRNKSASVD